MFPLIGRSLADFYFFLSSVFRLSVFRSTEASPQRGGSGCVLAYFDLCGVEGESRASVVECRVSLALA
jgi:hypothetical protein